jgi:hypothetical protein
VVAGGNDEGSGAALQCRISMHSDSSNAATSRRQILKTGAFTGGAVVVP